MQALLGGRRGRRWVSERPSRRQAVGGRAQGEIGADAPVVVAEVLPQARQDADQVHMHGMARADRVAGEDGGEDALVLGVGDFHTLVLTK